MNELNKQINKHNKIVILTGAGVSTDSGIPDFRSPNGLYNENNPLFKNHKPEYLLSRECLYNDTKLFYEYWREKMANTNHMPNITHHKITEMEQAGKLLGVITQNIDGLHQAAGTKNVIEIHGSLRHTYCSKCHKDYPAGYIITNNDPIPKCSCRGLIRPDVTLYGEYIQHLNEAKDMMLNADMMIVVGTSLTVSPANLLLDMFTGDELIIINNEPTALDHMATLLIHDNISNVFNAIQI